MKNKYFIKRNGHYYTDFTKEEIYSKIDNNNPKTFVFFLKELNYPYIKTVWQRLLSEHPDKRIFGRYCATMRLAAYRPFLYTDTLALNADTMANLTEEYFLGKISCHEFISLARQFYEECSGGINNF